MANVRSPAFCLVSSWLPPNIYGFKVGIIASEYALSETFWSCDANFEHTNV